MSVRGVDNEGTGEKDMMKSFMICTPHQILFGLSNEGVCSICGRGEKRVLGLVK